MFVEAGAGDPGGPSPIMTEYAPAVSSAPKVSSPSMLAGWMRFLMGREGLEPSTDGIMSRTGTCL